MINIKELFKNEKLMKKSNGDYKTVCPDCGLQGGRTEGFILFPNKNISYCHTSGKHFTLLETYALRNKLIKCIDGNESGESKWVLHDEGVLTEALDMFKEEFTEADTLDLKLHMGLNDDFLIKEYSKKTGDIISTKANIDKVAKYIINKLEIKTVCGIKGDSIYVYEEGIWTEKGKGRIRSFIEWILKTYARNNTVNEILEKIKRKTETTQKAFDVVPDYKMCLVNGVLDFESIDDIKFEKHCKDYNFKSKFPIEYNPKVENNKVEKFIEDVFYPADIPQVQEWFGLNLIRKYLYKKGALIHGPKNTGKSVFLNLLVAFLGQENVSDLSLQKISAGKSFDLLQLKDKFANIHDDLSIKDLNDGGGYKMCVGDGWISGEKKFGDHVKFRNTAKMIFACNQIPPVRDVDDDAYYDRFLPWKMDNIVDPKDKNPQLIEELTTPEELSGLLNYAICGYARLRKQNSFSNERDSESIKELMVENGNSLMRFVSEILIEAIGETITKDEMYKQYCHYCSSQKPKISPCSKDQLGKRLHRHAHFIRSEKSADKRYWLNVKVNSLVNVTADTPLQKPIENSRDSNSSIEIKNIKLPDLYQLSQKESVKIPSKSVEKTSDNKPKSDREVQFWEADECKDIKPNHTKDDILKWITANPNYDFRVMYDKFGVGCLKFRNELKRGGLI